MSQQSLDGSYFATCSIHHACDLVLAISPISIRVVSVQLALTDMYRKFSEEDGWVRVFASESQARILLRARPEVRLAPFWIALHKPSVINVHAIVSWGFRSDSSWSRRWSMAFVSVRIVSDASLHVLNVADCERGNGSGEHENAECASDETTRTAFDSEVERWGSAWRPVSDALTEV